MATPRLFLDSPLHEGAHIELGKEACHYILTVMRLKGGDQVRIFNGQDGEWLGELGDVSKKTAILTVTQKLRDQRKTPDLELLFAPVKKTRTDFIVEKATELGVSIIRPVLTHRTIADKVRVERLMATAREAAEQTERLDLPEVDDAISLDKVLKDWPEGRVLIFCDEAGDNPGEDWGGDTGRAGPLLDVLKTLDPNQPVSLLIGPEGGFDDKERTLLRSLDCVRPVSLGPRILRADTAACAALGVIQAVIGDWSLTPRQ